MPRRIIKAVNDYVFQVEDLHNRPMDGIHCTRVKLCRAGSLDTETIMSHAISSETVMIVSRLLRLEKNR